MRLHERSKRGIVPQDDKKEARAKMGGSELVAESKGREH